MSTNAPKPTALAVIPDGIPAELKLLRRWVCWRYEIRDGKWTKPPYIAGAQDYAKSTDPATHRSFNEALAAYQKHPGYYDGIGFALMPGDGFVGLDLDHVCDPQSGEVQSWTAEQAAHKRWSSAVPEPSQIVDAINSYSEISPSGTGIRIIVRGELSAALKHGAIEIYKEGRYLTFTGHRISNAPAEIRNAATALRTLYIQFGGETKSASPAAAQEATPPTNQKGKKASKSKKTKTPTAEQIIDHAEKAENCDKFKQLFDGDISGYPSPSEADAALCSIIAFWSAGNAALIDEIFRRSQLLREKWDEKHSGDGRTYGQMTVDSALAGCSKFYDWSKDGKKAKKKSDNALFHDLAEIILQTDHFAIDGGGRLFRFSNGAYRSKAEPWLKARVKTLLQQLGDAESWSSKLANETLEFIRVDRPQLWERPPLDVINVRNGLLRVLDESGNPIPFAALKLEPHSSAWLSTTQLPVDFDPVADCPAIKQFVAEVFPADAVCLAWEVPTWLCRAITDIQKAILLLGPGGNGKSTWLNLITAFLGKVNVASLTLHRLEADKFAAARLYGKLANICPDLPTEHLAGTSVFKSITGGDPLVGEHKFHDQFEFTPYARLIFSANSSPRSQDASQGFFDRWFVIPFEKPIRGTDHEISRQELDARLTAPSELSGMLNKVLQTIPAMHRQHSFSRPASTEAAWSEFKATTDPLAVWLERYTVEDSTAVVPMATILAAYNAYLERHGRPAVSKKKFGNDLRTYRPNVDDKQRTVGGKLVWCYIGIGLTAKSESLISHDSHDNPLLVSRGENDGKVAAGGREKEEVEEQEQDRADPVNRVNPVNHLAAHCRCNGQGPLPVESPDENRTGWLKTVCGRCGKWLGNRQDDAHPLAAAPP